MQSSYLLALLVSAVIPVSLSAGTEFCFKDENKKTQSFIFEEEIESQSLITTANGEQSVTLYSDKQVLSGEEAQADADLIGEEVKESTVWIWKDVFTKESGVIAVVEGVSGTKYFIDTVAYAVKADTKTCNKKSK